MEKYDIAFETISKEEIDLRIEQFDKTFDMQENTLAKIFAQYKSNTDEKEVLIKVTLLNAFYGTRLNTFPREKGQIDVINMAKHIAYLANDSDFDLLIYSNDEKQRCKAVQKISEERSEYKTEKHKKAYSFATKFCSWHNPDGFPIVDQFSKGMLYYMNHAENTKYHFYNKIFNQADLNDYGFFCEVYVSLKKFLEELYGAKMDLKMIDKFLWSFGKLHDVTF